MGEVFTQNKYLAPLPGFEPGHMVLETTALPNELQRHQGVCWPFFFGRRNILLSRNDCFRKYLLDASLFVVRDDLFMRENSRHTALGTISRGRYHIWRVFRGEWKSVRSKGRHRAAGWKPNTRNVGDGLAFLADCPQGSVATAIYDPQYRGVMDRLSYGNEGARQKGRAQLTQMPEATIREFLTGIDRALRPQGHLFLWIDKFHLCEGIGPWIEDISLEVVDLLTWDKGRMGMGYRTRRQSEYAFILQKPPKRAKDVWTDRALIDVLMEKVSRQGHAHRKPVGIQARLIAATTRPGDIVIDPAAGSFSVLASCERVGGRTFFLARISRITATSATTDRTRCQSSDQHLAGIWLVSARSRPGDSRRRRMT